MMKMNLIHEGHISKVVEVNMPKRLAHPCDRPGCRELTYEKHCERHKQLPIVTVICGPPGSGKTTYVRNHSKYGDLIFDLDWVWQSLSGLPYLEKPDPLTPFIFTVRDAVYARLTEESELERAWIIAGAPTAREREQLSDRFNAKIVLLRVPIDVCLDRIENDEKRPGSADIIKPWIERWWRSYTPRDGDILLG